MTFTRKNQHRIISTVFPLSKLAVMIYSLFHILNIWVTL